MIRRPHLMAGNKVTELPHNAIWTDTETWERKDSSRVSTHHLRFGWACFQRSRVHEDWTETEWKRYTKPAAFWTWVEERARSKTKLYLFAHNWSFDAAVLHTFDILPKRGWKLTGCVIECPPVVLTWRKGDRVIEMLDTLNWWRVPLVELGKSVQVPKLPMPSPAAPRKVWDTYCRNDVEVIRRAMVNWWAFLREYDLGGFARTLAGQAMRAYRHRFMDHKILVDAEERPTRLARAAYHGGRTECFRLGKIKGPIHVYDVNSMYPAVMRNEEFPTVLILYTRRGTLPEVARWVKNRSVVAKCRIRTDDPAYGIVRNGKLIFPVGTFEAELTTPDLVYALKHGHLVDVSEVAVYTRAPIFTRFVDQLYQLRQAAADRGDEVNRFLLKILMNSLYGKFGQSGRVWETVEETDDFSVAAWTEVDVDSGECYAYRRLAGIVQLLRREAESYGSHPAIAAHVTAFARRLLWSLVQVAGRRNVVYVDTDSLYVTNEGAQLLATHVDASRLGALKHEATHQDMVIHGPKDYVTPEGVKTKGVKRTASWSRDGHATQLQWSSLAGLVRRQDLGAPTTTEVAKALSRIYTKGTVDRRGRVSPFVLTEDGD